jgi:DNA/RNA endonuclease G (NUC1)
MKNLFLVILVCLSTVGFGQTKLRDSVNYQTPNFRIVYSEILEQPKWVTFTVKCPTGTASRAGMEFYTDKNIKTSDNEDYVNNEWDKGHMAPAASFNCDKEMLYSTFTYINSAMQQQSLNRGPWKKLEIQERELAKVNHVKVYIKVEFDAVPKRVPAGAAIPKGFYKEVKVGDRTKFCYYFPNVAPTSSDLNTFKCNCR